MSLLTKIQSDLRQLRQNRMGHSTTGVKYQFHLNQARTTIYYNNRLDDSVVIIIESNDNDKHHYYMNRLILGEDKVVKKYFKNIDFDILSKIMNGTNSLSFYFDKITDAITEGTPVNINMQMDTLYRRAVAHAKRNSKKSGFAPFLRTTKQTKMTDEYLDYIHHTFGVENRDLRFLQSHNFTFQGTYEVENSLSKRAIERNIENIKLRYE